MGGKMKKLSIIPAVLCCFLISHTDRGYSRQQVMKAKADLSAAWKSLCVNFKLYYKKDDRKIYFFNRANFRRGKRVYIEVLITNHGGIKSIPFKLKVRKKKDNSSIETENISPIPAKGTWRKTFHQRYWSGGQKSTSAWLIDKNGKRLNEYKPPPKCGSYVLNYRVFMESGS
jgi:hypothetical protein